MCSIKLQSAQTKTKEVVREVGNMGFEPMTIRCLCKLVQFGQPRPRSHLYVGCNPVYHKHLTCTEVNALHVAAQLVSNRTMAAVRLFQCYCFTYVQTVYLPLPCHS